MTSDYLSLLESAEFLHMSPRTVYREIHDGKLPPPIKVRGRRFFKQNDLVSYQQRMEKESRKGWKPQ